MTGRNSLASNTLSRKERKRLAAERRRKIAEKFADIFAREVEKTKPNKKGRVPIKAGLRAVEHEVKALIAWKPQEKTTFLKALQDFEEACTRVISKTEREGNALARLKEISDDGKTEKSSS